MTSTDVTVDFERAAAMRRAVRAAVDAKLDAGTTPEPGVFKEMLHLLVAVGLLSPEQARALWEAVTGGTYLGLPPIPWPDSPVPLNLYDIIRAKLDRRHAEVSEVDFSLGDLFHIGEMITAVAHAVEEAAHALADLWHTIAG